MAGEETPIYDHNDSHMLGVLSGRPEDFRYGSTAYRAAEMFGSKPSSNDSTSDTISGPSSYSSGSASSSSYVYSGPITAKDFVLGSALGCGLTLCLAAATFGAIGWMVVAAFHSIEKHSNPTYYSTIPDSPLHFSTHVLNCGDQVTVEKIESGWAKITLPNVNHQAFVASKSLSATPPKCAAM